ncbi:MAG TPA: hypothetical protein VMO78_03890 [Rhizomicrobium sp.]|nr:hypothetical protein [Rhizomicrobium sp.]
MHCYDTKIIGRSGTVNLQVAENHFSDFAATRAARKLCGYGDIVEVWRGDVCIYSERPKGPIALVWPAISTPLSGRALSRQLRERMVEAGKSE